MPSKILLLTTALLSSIAFAQTETATLRGVVADSSGKPVASATLLITEMGTDLSRQVVSGQDGGYEVPFLKPGKYRVNIDQRGFQSFVATNIQLRAGEVRRFDPALTTGELSQTQETDESGKSAHSEHGSVDSIIDLRARWHDAPVFDRRQSPLPLLVTGPDTQGNGDGLVMGGQSSRSRQTWSMDGVPHDAVAATVTGDPDYFDSVNVVVSNPTVEAYRPVGFDMISRRGTDTWHGTVYARYGNSAMDSRPYFSASKPFTRFENAGGEAGGALIPGRTFVYGGWAYQREKRGETLFADVPTVKMRTGDFGQFLNASTAPNGVVTVIRDPRNGVPFPNNVVPGTRISAVANNFVTNYYPSPNAADANQIAQNYSWENRFGREPFSGHWPFGRVDQKLTDNNNLYFRFLQVGTGTILPGSVSQTLDSTQRLRLRSYLLSDTQTFASNISNQAKLAVIQSHVRQGQEEQNITPLNGSQVVSTVALQGVNSVGLTAAGFPSISIAGLTGLNSPLPGAGDSKQTAREDRTWMFEDTMAWSKGRHSIQFGGQYFSMRWRDNTVPQATWGAFSFSGAFTGNAFADFLLGLPATSSRVNPTVNRPITQSQAGVFLTDSFRVAKRLTVDFGLRWDYFPAPEYTDGYMSSWNQTTGQVIVAPGTLTAVSTLYPTSIKVTTGQVVPKADMKNFRPRVSAAYRLNDNTVIRGAYGEFTAAAPFGSDSYYLSSTNPYHLTETYTNSITNGTAAITFPKPFPTAPTASQTPSQSVTALPNRIDDGVIRQYNLSLERTIGRATVRASYIGARGTGMDYTVNIDKPQASTTPFTNARKPYPQFASATVIRNDGEWRYDAAQVEARRSVGPLTVVSNFTWSNNVANYLNTLDPYHVTNYWTRDAADRRLYWTTSGSWAIPVGKGHRLLPNPTPALGFLFTNWTVNAIATFASGQFYTPVFTGPDPANASPGFVTQPADCIGDPSAGAGTIGRWFNPAAISAPPSTAGRYGTCGMNSLKGYPIHVGHVSLVKRAAIGERAHAIFTAQISNVTNTPHFTTPNANISTANAGAFTGSSAIDVYSPERLGYRQINLKLRLEF